MATVNLRQEAKGHRNLQPRRREHTPKVSESDSNKPV